MPDTKKFLDADGVTYLARLLDNYPNNELLGTVIDSIGDILEDYNSRLETLEGLVNADEVSY